MIGFARPGDIIPGTEVVISRKPLLYKSPKKGGGWICVGDRTQAYGDTLAAAWDMWFRLCPTAVVRIKAIDWGMAR